MPVSTTVDSRIEYSQYSLGLSVSAIAEQLNEKRARAGDLRGVGIVNAIRTVMHLEDTR